MNTSTNVLIIAAISAFILLAYFVVPVLIRFFFTVILYMFQHPLQTILYTTMCLIGILLLEDLKKSK